MVKFLLFREKSASEWWRPIGGALDAPKRCLGVAMGLVGVLGARLQKELAC